MTDSEKALLDETMIQVDAYQLRRGIASFLWQFTVALFVTGVVCLLVSKVISLNGRLDSQATAATIRTTAGEIQALRDRRIITFLCADLRSEDAWRQQLHELDRKYRHTDSAFYRARDKFFSLREKEAAARGAECNALLDAVK